MKKIKVMIVFGTRPDAVKMAPLAKELYKNRNIDLSVLVTGQHREMLDQVLDIFKLVPDYDMNIMQQKQSLEHVTSSIMTGISKILKKEKPDIVLVHGDTATCFAASLSAFYNKIMVGHVEAGLRTFDKYSPFPEEINRKLTGVIADMHFCPTVLNKNNLIKEGISENNIYITGNTIIDAMSATVSSNYIFDNKALNEIDFNKKVIAMTAHRRENLGKPLENICMAVKDLALSYDIEVVYTVHLNPVVQKTARSILTGVNNIHLIDPLNVRDMHNLMNLSYFVMTDSGGLQEEAPSLGKPVLVLRKETERPEAVAAGTVKLAGINRENIKAEVEMLLNNNEAYTKMASAVNPYGDGKASSRIVNSILYKFKIADKKPDEFN